MKVLRRTLKGKIFNKITANDSKSYLGYLNKLVVEYKNTDHSSIGRKPIHADYSASSSKEFESRHKAHKFKVGDRMRITD